MQLLCSSHPEELIWEPVDWNNLPSGTLEKAILAGYQKDIRSYLYVGRVKLNRHYKIGKVVPLERDGPGLWVWEGERPLRVTKFELLKTM